MQSYIFTPIPSLNAPLPTAQSREDRLRVNIENLKERRQQVHANITAHAVKKIQAHRVSARFKRPDDPQLLDSQQTEDYLSSLLEDVEPIPSDSASTSANAVSSVELDHIHQAVDLMDSYDEHFNEVLSSYTSSLAKLTNENAPQTLNSKQGPTPRQPSRAPSSVQRRESVQASSPSREPSRRLSHGASPNTERASNSSSSNNNNNNNTTNVSRPGTAKATQASPPTAPRALRTSSHAQASHWAPPPRHDTHRTSLTWVRCARPETPNGNRPWKEQSRVMRPDEEPRRQSSDWDGGFGSDVDLGPAHYVDASRDPRRMGRGRT